MINLADPTLTADDLHNLMMKIHKMYGIDKMEEEVKLIISRYSSDEELPMSYIESNSYDMQTFILGMKDKPQSFQNGWDMDWQELSHKYNYEEYHNLGTLHRKTFSDIRQSYLMFNVGKHILGERPKTFGVLQYLTEKYINDVLDNAENEIPFRVVYEMFNGENDAITVINGNNDIDLAIEKPNSHWVGRTPFDSFYMIPLVEKKTRKWKFIPLDLIRSFQIDRLDLGEMASSGEGDEGYEF